MSRLITKELLDSNSKRVWKYEVEISTIATNKFSMLWHKTSYPMIVQLDGGSLRLLLYIAASGILRYGENTFMLGVTERKRIMVDLKISLDTMYRHLSSLKDYGVVGMLGPCVYSISKNVLEYGIDKSDWKNGKPPEDIDGSGSNGTT